MERGILHIWFIALTAVMLLAGCKESDEDVETGSPVNVDLAFSFSSKSSSAKTRLGDDNLDGNAANIEILRVIPMKDNTPDNLGEVSISSEDTVSKANAMFYRSSFCSMATGDNRCLVYAKDKRASRIDATIPTLITSTNQIGFRLNSIYQNTDAPSEALALAEHLNTVANTESWQASDNAILSNLFNNFTNHGYNLPGSAASVKQWLMSLASVCQSYLDTPPSSILEDHKVILKAIKDSATVEAEKITVNDTVYPRNIGLPDGAAALRWTSGGFTPRLQTTTLDNINSVSRFAYPPSLYYFVNSSLLTSNSKFITTAYNNDTWTEVKDTFTAGSEISSRTKSVILADEVEYAVSRLEVKIKTDSTSWTYPLKGIIVCGQRPVNYMFEQDNNYNSDVKFVYDSKVEGDCRLSTTETLACRTLVFQSYDGEDVDIILEFENNGGSFECSDGTVYPDTRFYLVGKVELNGAAKRAFTKDQTTTVSMNVTSRDKAYNVLPSLLSSNLEIGVETTPKWVSDKPTIIRLE